MPTIQVEGAELYYRTAGKGEDLLMIHGLGSSTQDWEMQWEYFTRRYRVTAFDVRGHGRSTKDQGPYSLRLFQRDTRILIERLGLSPVHVMGVSMGGMIALELAMRRPKAVRSLVLINTPFEVRLRNWKHRIIYLQRVATIAFIGMRTFGGALSRRLFPEPHQAHLRKTLVDRWNQNDKGCYLRAMSSLVGWSSVEWLDRIACPTLVVAGDMDYTSPQTKKRLARRMPLADVEVITDSRHATPVDQPERMNEVVERFLSAQGGMGLLTA